MNEVELGQRPAQRIPGVVAGLDPTSRRGRWSDVGRLSRSRAQSCGAADIYVRVLLSTSRSLMQKTWVRAGRKRLDSRVFSRELGRRVRGEIAGREPGRFPCRSVPPRRVTAKNASSYISRLSASLLSNQSRQGARHRTDARGLRAGRLYVRSKSPGAVSSAPSLPLHSSVTYRSTLPYSFGSFSSDRTSGPQRVIPVLEGAG